MVYYNENDPKAAAWLRELIKHGLIAQGEVDDRSIAEVQAADLAGFSQCHFFAGIGGWSYALRLADWPDNRRVWTGSCPCQPYSVAGKRLGNADDRNLWPTWFRLIQECRPPMLFGEQVTGAIKYGWLDGVGRDLEGCGYAIGAAVLSASAVNAPHRRDRLWFVANTERDEQSREEPCSRKVRRVGRPQQSVPWDSPWPLALALFRGLDDGLPRRVGATDAIRNAIVPQVAAEFIMAATNA